MLIILGVLLLVSSILLMLAFKPFKLKGTYTPKPASGYQEAVGRIKAIQAQEGALDDLCTECGTILMTNDQKTENVIVFIPTAVRYQRCTNNYRRQAGCRSFEFVQ